MITTEEQVRAILADDFWSTEYVKLAEIPTAIKRYNAQGVLETNKWVKQFITDQEQSIQVSQTVYEGNPGRYTLIRATPWGVKHYTPYYQATNVGDPQFMLAKEHDSGEVEIWFGIEQIQTVNSAPIGIKRQFGMT